MAAQDHLKWDDLLQSLLDEMAESRSSRVSVERRELEAIELDLNTLVHAAERRFLEADSAAHVEHRELIRRDLVSMNTLRVRLRSLLRSAT